MIADFEYYLFFIVVRSEEVAGDRCCRYHNMQEKLQGLEISMSAYYLSCKDIGKYV